MGGYGARNQMQNQSPYSQSTMNRQSSYGQMGGYGMPQMQMGGYGMQQMSGYGMPQMGGYGMQPMGRMYR